MRVGDETYYYRFLIGLEAARDALDRSMEQLTDGKKVKRASDDPAGYHASLALRGRLVQLEGYARSGQAAHFDLSTIDSALGEVVNLLSSAQTEAMAAASGVTGGDTEARALTIDGIRERILALSNTNQNGRYLFGGTATLTSPFAEDGTYSGNDAEVMAPIDSSEEIAATFSGRRVFQEGGDIFTLLSDLAQAMRDGRITDIESAIPALKAALEHVADVRSVAGNRMMRIESMLDRHDDETLSLSKRISEIENANLEDVAVALQSAQTSQSAISAAAAKVLGRSLFDYLG